MASDITNTKYPRLVNSLIRCTPKVDILIYYFRLSVLLITYLFQARKVEITVIDIESP